MPDWDKKKLNGTNLLYKYYRRFRRDLLTPLSGCKGKR